MWEIVAKEIEKAIVIAIKKEAIRINMAIVINKEDITGIEDTTMVTTKRDLWEDTIQKNTEDIGDHGVNGIIIIVRIDIDIPKENIIMTNTGF
jgi:hypothetical protein